jgi:hypothetical protein
MARRCAHRIVGLQYGRLLEPSGAQPKEAGS